VNASSEHPAERLQEVDHTCAAPSGLAVKSVDLPTLAGNLTVVRKVRPASTSRVFTRLMRGESSGLSCLPCGDDRVLID